MPRERTGLEGLRGALRVMGRVSVLGSPVLWERESIWLGSGFPGTPPGVCPAAWRGGGIEGSLGSLQGRRGVRSRPGSPWTRGEGGQDVLAGGGCGLCGPCGVL